MNNMQDPEVQAFVQHMYEGWEREKAVSTDLSSFDWASLASTITPDTRSGVWMIRLIRSHAVDASGKAIDDETAQRTPGAQRLMCLSCEPCGGPQRFVQEYRGLPTSQDVLQSVHFSLQAARTHIDQLYTYL